MPTELTQSIEDRTVPPGQVVAWWLGGAGFVFKTSAGTQIYIDPYLSDIVNVIFGQSRAFPTPIDPEAARPDLLICTHWHEDHLDPGSIPVIARQNPELRFLMPPSAMSRSLSWGIPRNRILPIKRGESLRVLDVEVAAVAARHEAGLDGWETPDAVSLILSMEGLKVFFSGDTEYESSHRRLRSLGIDAAFLCINGVGGNMNAHEAALLGWQLGVRTLVPMHHYLWKTVDEKNKEATLDPRLLESTYQRLGGCGRVVIPSIGGEIVLTSKPEDRDSQSSVPQRST